MRRLLKCQFLVLDPVHERARRGEGQGKERDMEIGEDMKEIGR